MPLATLERTPPPFFRQGHSAATRLAFFAALAVFLMVADARFTVVAPLRQALAAVLMPMQGLAGLPVQWLRDGGRYLEGLSSAQRGEREAREALLRQSVQAQKTQQLERDNASLRALLDLGPALATRSFAAEVLYEAADPFSYKWIIGRGGRQGVALGAPVVNAAGVLGQVTRVYAQSAEVTLLADKDAAIPVLNARTQQRAAAYGGAGGGLMELRFTSANSDVRVGDAFVTSGLDGVYPAGLPVGTVHAVDRRAESGFARVVVQPTSSPDGVRFVLVLEPMSAQLPERPAAPTDSTRSPREPREPREGRAGARGPARKASS
ncbi:MAG: rod shape-determining protein MreC [Rubrivivax sp.]|nr:rod shape-determining protein MreC [Rubrivivax sp.]